MKIGCYTRKLIGKRQFAKALVQFFIDNRYFQNVNRFKKGDQVRYNWKAKFFLGSLFEKRRGKTFIVTNVWHKGQNVYYYNNEYGEGSCDVFWLRPARKSERINAPAPKSGNTR